MHGHGPVRFFQVDEISGEALDVAVEDKTDELAVAIDNGRSGIAPDNVRRHDEIQRGGEINLIATLDEAWRQVKRRLVIKACRAIIQAIERRFRRSLRSIHWITLHSAVRETQREGRIRIDRLSVDRKPCLGDFFTRRSYYRLNRVFILLTKLAEEWIHLARQNNERIC